MTLSWTSLSVSRASTQEPSHDSRAVAPSTLLAKQPRSRQGCPPRVMAPAARRRQDGIRESVLVTWGHAERAGRGTRKSVVQQSCPSRWPKHSVRGDSPNPIGIPSTGCSPPRARTKAFPSSRGTACSKPSGSESSGDVWPLIARAARPATYGVRCGAQDMEQSRFRRIESDHQAAFGGEFQVIVRRKTVNVRWVKKPWTLLRFTHQPQLEKVYLRRLVWTERAPFIRRTRSRTQANERAGAIDAVRPRGGARRRRGTRVAARDRACGPSRGKRPKVRAGEFTDVHSWRIGLTNRPLGVEWRSKLSARLGVSPVRAPRERSALSHVSEAAGRRVCWLPRGSERASALLAVDIRAQPWDGGAASWLFVVTVSSQTLDGYDRRWVR